MSRSTAEPETELQASRGRSEERIAGISGIEDTVRTRPTESTKRLQLGSQRLE